jgi:hypothetical protein
VHTIVSFAFSARCGISLARYYPLLVGRLDEWLCVPLLSLLSAGWHALFWFPTLF